ncbi:flagellar type III secretion system protein FlhB [bacterium]|nr:flagellar type III secretion system protein FlhB [bacterium]
MSEFGEKTEQATPKKLEEAQQRGQIPRSAEVQTLFVLMAGTAALAFTSRELWQGLLDAQFAILGHLSDIHLTNDSLRGYVAGGLMFAGRLVAPVTLAVMGAGLLAGGVQSRFQTAPKALEPQWEKVDPMAGLKRVFTMQNAAPAALAFIKLAAIVGLSYGVVKEIMHDPIFFSPIHPARVAEFLASSALKLTTRLVLVMILIAGADYAWQVWKHGRDLMMTRQEVRDENKSTEGDQQVKARQRRRRNANTQRKMLAEVPLADVVVTNPTHLAVALRYDRRTMKAPKIVAKGARKFALRIREIAGQNQVPIIENKPLARMMFKYGKVGGEIPAQVYAAVAEVLAYVYRVNRYRYWREQNKT